MSHWNHRVIITETAGERMFDIHEVYYDEKGKPENWTENPVSPCGETLVELRAEIDMFKAAFFHPALIIKKKDGEEVLEVEKTETVKIDDFHRHEALDRTSVFCDQFEGFIAAHPVIAFDVELNGMAQKILEQLSELYQKIGCLRLKDKS